jgi:hypothetical protein
MPTEINKHKANLMILQWFDQIEVGFSEKQFKDKRILLNIERFKINLVWNR